MIAEAAWVARWRLRTSTTGQRMPAFSWLDPFAGLRFDLVYARFSAAIDFALCLVLFSGVCWIAFGKRFPGKGGRLLRVGLSLILSISLIVFEQKTGFNLAKLGPLALVILLVLFAILVARLLLKSGSGTFPSMWLTYVLWYVSLRFLAPEVHEQMVFALPWLNPLMSWMALSGFAVLGISLLLGHGEDRPGKPSEVKTTPSLRRPKPKIKWFGPPERKGPKATETETTTAEDLEDKVKEIEAKEKSFEARLKWIMEALGNECSSYADLEQVQKEMRYLLAENHQVLAALTRLKQLDACLLKSDLKNEALLEDAAERYRDLPAGIKQGIRREIQQRRRRLEVEKRISEFEARSMDVTRNLEFLISQAMGTLAAGDRKGAVEWLYATLQRDQQAKQLTKEIEGFSGALRKMAKESIGRS